MLRSNPINPRMTAAPKSAAIEGQRVDRQRGRTRLCQKPRNAGPPRPGRAGRPRSGLRPGPVELEHPAQVGVLVALRLGVAEEGDERDNTLAHPGGDSKTGRRRRARHDERPCLALADGQPARGGEVPDGRGRRRRVECDVGRLGLPGGRGGAPPGPPPATRPAVRRRARLSCRARCPSAILHRTRRRPSHDEEGGARVEWPRGPRPSAGRSRDESKRTAAASEMPFASWRPPWGGG